MENTNGDITSHHNSQQPPPPPSFSQTPEQETHQRCETLFDRTTNVSDCKNHQFPLARIKKIMKSDPEVSMISGEAPVLFSKGCEMFIVDLTNRVWLNAEENKRRTLQKSDIFAAVASDFVYDFLLDIFPGDNDPIAADSSAKPGFVGMPHHDSVGVPVYYPPPPPQLGLVMGTPVVDGNGMYAPPKMESWPGGEDGEDEPESSRGKGGEN